MVIIITECFTVIVMIIITKWFMSCYAYDSVDEKNEEVFFSFLEFKMETNFIHEMHSYSSR